MARRDVGATGESFAQALAESAGIVVVRSNPDKHGWDQLWELQRSDEVTPTTLPLDLRPSRASCKVQVKSGVGLTKTTQTNGRAGVWRDVKLSTWIELCGFLGPAFFFVLDFDDDESHAPRRGYLVHIDELWMSTTLENARTRKTLPHKTRQSLIMMKAEEVLPLTSDGLRNALNSAIGPDPMAYAIHKRETWRSVGYDKKGKDLIVVRSKVNRDFTNQTDELISLALGLTKLRFESLERHDNRFSNPVLMEERVEEGTVSVQPPNLGPVSIKIEQPEGDSPLILEGELYSTASVAPWLPLADMRCRLVTHSFELIFGPTGGTYTIVLRDPCSAGVTVPLRRFAEHGKFLDLILSSRQRALRMEISLQDPQHGSSWHGQLSGHVDDEDYATIVAESSQAASVLAHRLAIDPGLEVDPVALCAQKDDIQLLCALLNGDTSGCRIEFQGDDPPPHLGMILPRGVMLREDCFVYVVGILHGRPVERGSWFVLKPISIQLITSGHCASPEDANAIISEGVRNAQNWLQENDVAHLPAGVGERAERRDQVLDCDPTTDRSKH